MYTKLYAIYTLVVLLFVYENSLLVEDLVWNTSELCWLLLRVNSSWWRNTLRGINAKKYTLLMELCQSNLSSGLFWARCEQWKSLTFENSPRSNKWTKSIRQWLLWLLAASTQRPLYDAISCCKWLCTSFEPFAVKLLDHSCAWGGCVWICSSQRNFMWSIISSKWKLCDEPKLVG